MINRKIELVFDKKKQAVRAIRTEISQRSFILLILVSIYIRFLFSKIKKAQKKFANCSLKLFKKYFQEQIETQ